MKRETFQGVRLLKYLVRVRIGVRFRVRIRVEVRVRVRVRVRARVRVRVTRLELGLGLGCLLPLVAPSSVRGLRADHDVQALQWWLLVDITPRSSLAEQKRNDQHYGRRHQEISHILLLRR